MTARLATISLCLSAILAAGNAVAAQDAEGVGKAFADHCFSPLLTAQTAQANLGPSGARIEFYDLRPSSGTAPSPVTGRAPTPGTDRRCEVAFDGAEAMTAADWLARGLAQEGLVNKPAMVPAGFIQQTGATMIAAAQLNPNRIAVVQVGVRDTSAGTRETFLSVERLHPLDEVGK